jgi:hypothetical protein
MQKNATDHTANISMNALAERLWPARSPSVSPCDFLWGILKDKVDVNSPNSLRELKENIRQEISVIPRQLRRMSRHFFQDVGPAEEQKVGTSRDYFELR